MENLHVYGQGIGELLGKSWELAWLRWWERCLHQTSLLYRKGLKGSAYLCSDKELWQAQDILMSLWLVCVCKVLRKYLIALQVILRTWIHCIWLSIIFFKFIISVMVNTGVIWYLWEIDSRTPWGCQNPPMLKSLLQNGIAGRPPHPQVPYPRIPGWLNAASAEPVDTEGPLCLPCLPQIGFRVTLVILCVSCCIYWS